LPEWCEGNDVGAKTLDAWDHLNHIARNETTRYGFHYCLELTEKSLTVLGEHGAHSLFDTWKFVAHTSVHAHDPVVPPIIPSCTQ